MAENPKLARRQALLPPPAPDGGVALDGSAGPGTAEAALLHGLAALRDKSLIGQEPTEDGPRLRLFHTTAPPEWPRQGPPEAVHRRFFQ